MNVWRNLHQFTAAPGQVTVSADRGAMASFTSAAIGRLELGVRFVAVDVRVSARWTRVSGPASITHTDPRGSCSRPDARRLRSDLRSSRQNHGKNGIQPECVRHELHRSLIQHGMWTHPRDRSASYNTIEYWQDLARIAERGLFDGIFLADIVGVYDVYKASPCSFHFEYGPASGK